MPVNPKSLQNLKPMKKGETLNPGGRALGTLNKLSTAFMKNFMESYEEHGAHAIEMLRVSDPVSYVRMAMQLSMHVIPKKVEISLSLHDQYIEQRDSGMIDVTDYEEVDEEDAFTA